VSLQITDVILHGLDPSMNWIGLGPMTAFLSTLRYLILVVPYEIILHSTIYSCQD